jgi:hypothetical protein
MGCKLPTQESPEELRHLLGAEFSTMSGYQRAFAAKEGAEYLEKECIVDPTPAPVCENPEATSDAVRKKCLTDFFRAFPTADIKGCKLPREETDDELRAMINAELMPTLMKQVGMSPETRSDILQRAFVDIKTECHKTRLQKMMTLGMARPRDVAVHPLPRTGSRSPGGSSVDGAGVGAFLAGLGSLSL